MVLALQNTPACLKPLGRAPIRPGSDRNKTDETVFTVILLDR